MSQYVVQFHNRMGCCNSIILSKAVYELFRKTVKEKMID